MHRLIATLPYPVSMNQTIRTGKGRVFKSPRAKDWISKSFEVLRSNGFVPQEHREYYCEAKISLYTSRMDVDGPLKSLLDIVMWALSDVQDPLDSKQTRWCKGVQDKWNGRVLINKYFEKSKEKQRIELEYTFTPIQSKEEFNMMERDI